MRHGDPDDNASGDEDDAVLLNVAEQMVVILVGFCGRRAGWGQDSTRCCGDDDVYRYAADNLSRG